MKKLIKAAEFGNKASNQTLYLKGWSAAMAHKKTMLFSSFILASSMFLAACGDDSEQVSQPVTDNPEDPATSETSPDSNPGGGTTEEFEDGELYGFKEISIDVDYPDQDDAYDIQYEEERGAVKAEYENKFTNANLEGDDAYNEMQGALENLQITTSMSDEEVITQVVEAFGLEDGYSSIEIEVTYADNTEVDYEQKN